MKSGAALFFAQGSGQLGGEAFLPPTGVGLNQGVGAAQSQTVGEAVVIADQ
jgi:hypothetical protein